eukprot:105651-Prymnesium_polylepis.1
MMPALMMWNILDDVVPAVVTCFPLGTLTTWAASAIIARPARRSRERWLFRKARRERQLRVATALGRAASARARAVGATRGCLWPNESGEARAHRNR